MGNLLWFLCVKGSILKKDGSCKTIVNFAIIVRRRTKNNWILPEKLSLFFKAGFCVPRTTFSGKKRKNWSFFRFIFFGIWAETQLTLAKAFQHCCQNFDRRVQRYIFGKFSGTKLKGFFEFFSFLSKKIPEVMQKLLFTTWQELFGTKAFFSFWDSELNILGHLPRKVLPVLSKQHYAFWEQHFQSKWCFWTEFILLLFMFSGRWEKALGVWWNNFGMYVKL